MLEIVQTSVLALELVAIIAVIAFIANRFSQKPKTAIEYKYGSE